MSKAVRWKRMLRAKKKSLDLITGNLHTSSVHKMWLCRSQGTVELTRMVRRWMQLI